MQMRLLKQFGVLLAISLSAQFAFADLVPFEKNSIVSGQIDAVTECAKPSDRHNPIVWLSVGQVLLYQVEVPVNGTYEFHVLPGKYDVLVTNSQGCSAQSTLTVAPQQVAKADLKLVVSSAPTKKVAGN